MNIPLDNPLVIALMMTLVGIVIHHVRAERERLYKAVDGTEVKMAGALEKAAKILADRMDAIENRRIQPLEAQTSEVARNIAALGSELKLALSDLKSQIAASHPTKSDFAAMKADLDRIADRLVPPELLEFKERDRQTPGRRR